MLGFSTYKIATSSLQVQMDIWIDISISIFEARMDINFEA